MEVQGVLTMDTVTIIEHIRTVEVLVDRLTAVATAAAGLPRRERRQQVVAEAPVGGQARVLGEAVLQCWLRPGNWELFSQTRQIQKALSCRVFARAVYWWKRLLPVIVSLLLTEKT